MKHVFFGIGARLGIAVVVSGLAAGAAWAQEGLPGMPVPTAQYYSKKWVYPTKVWSGRDHVWTRQGVDIERNLSLFSIASPGLWRLQEWNPEESRTHVTLRFLGLTQDGRGLRVEHQFRNADFKKVFVDESDTVRVRSEWYLDNCDGKIIEFEPMDPSRPIESVIGALNRYDFSEYMGCTLRMNKRALACSETGAEINCKSNATMVVRDSGEISNPSYRVTDGFSELGYSPAIVYSPVSASDSASDQWVKDAASRLASILKEYGNTLVLLKDAAPVKRTVALRDFIARNRDDIQRSFATIRDHLGRSSLLTKLNVTTTINQGYGYVHYLEAKIHGSFEMDELIRR